MKKIRDNLFLIISGAVFLVLGGVLGWWFEKINVTRGSLANDNTVIREYPASRKFINPLLATGDNETLHLHNSLETDIKNHILNYSKNAEVRDVAVYFRDLNSGLWIGVNEDKKFAPASLYKVALMITYLKQAESDPSVLLRKIEFTKENDSGDLDEAESSSKLTVGQVYTVPDLVYQMIVYSNNQAAGLLLATVDHKLLKDTFDILKISMPEISNIGESMSPKEYSLFFRILYNSNYLGDVMSEKALELLSKTDFKNGLIAGLPKDPIVSHKYGHRVVRSASGAIAEEELHDCGIVYMPQKPYFVCVMTRGGDTDKLSKIIADISKLVFDSVGYR